MSHSKRTEDFKTTLDNYKGINAHIKRMLKDAGASDRSKRETMLVFEAVYNDMLVQGLDGDTELTIWGQKFFGDFRIKLGFEGAVYSPLEGGRDPGSVDSMVLKAYADRVDCRYHSGYNTIILIAKRSYSRTIILCLISMVLAVLAYFPMKAGMSTEVQKTLFNQIIFPFERLFTNAMLMVAAPVTFFSLLKNLTDAYIVAERNSSLRRLQRSTLVTSVISVSLAILFGHLWVIGHDAIQGKPVERIIGMKIPVGDIISSLMPSNIFEPFVTVSPFPLIILAALTTYALCSVGQFFDSMKNGIAGAYTLFSRMLSVIMFTLPIFCFMAIMDILIDRGLLGLINLLLLIIPAVVGLFVLASYYAIRMKRAGVALTPFVKKLRPLLHENLKINSAINAVPFNVRYCTVQYGMDKKRLEDSLPLLAQINLDGNCFIISLIAMLYIHLAEINVTWYEIIAIGALVLFLSLGAPNQPGSAIIGILIISNYLGAIDMLPMAIISEILFGSLLNIINVIGDIVTVTIEEKRVGRDPNAPQEGKVIVQK